MCDSILELRQRLLAIFHHSLALEKLAQKQHELFQTIFSRELALTRVRSFVGNIQHYLLDMRTCQYSDSVMYNRILVPPELKFNSNLPDKAGQFVRYSIETVRGLTGTAVYDGMGSFLSRRATANLDAPGMIIGEYIYAMQAGFYAFSIIIHSQWEYACRVGTFSMAAWMPDYTLYSIAHVDSLNAGETLVTLNVHVKADSALYKKEIRFVWEGTTHIEISHIFVEKIS
ncbi:hypothetical protein D3C75_771570 [compost metagenome]